MCTVPPPPPPLPLLAESKSTKCLTSPVINPNYPEDLCQWASDYPELREACIKNKICLNEPPYQYKYTHFQSIIQEGPTCGLVALSMLLNGTVSPAEILSIAKTEGFTNRGEMFSCKNMVQLAEKVFSLANMDSVRLYPQNGDLYSEIIINKVLDGAKLLVPYDADFNHSPCLKHGHKAHWTLICGIIIDGNTPENNVYVLSKHGKSKYLAVWKLSDLVKSNVNLVEFSPKREEEGELYIVPEGGIGGDNGLKNQFVIIQGV